MVSSTYRLVTCIEAQRGSRERVRMQCGRRDLKCVGGHRIEGVVTLDSDTMRRGTGAVVLKNTYKKI